MLLHPAVKASGGTMPANPGAAGIFLILDKDGWGQASRREMEAGGAVPAASWASPYRETAPCLTGWPHCKREGEQGWSLALDKTQA